jgi:hypothetical protein
VPENIDVKSASDKAVELLRIDNFIDAQKGEIFGRLENGYRNTMNRQDADLLFIAESLPLISAIVNVGSTLTNFKTAADWVKQKLPDAEPVSALSALTFIYVIDKGYKAAQNLGDEDKRRVWTKMRERVETLLGRK